MRLHEFRNRRPSDIDSGITHSEYASLVKGIKQRMKKGQPRAAAIKNEIMANWKQKKLDLDKLTKKLDLDNDIV